MRNPLGVTVGIGVLALGVVGIAATLVGRSESDPAIEAAAPTKSLPAVELPTCGDPTPTTATPPAAVEARSAAQRGLDFLGSEASAWTTQNQCYGCHVQAVTVEAMAVGIHNQYRIRDSDRRTVLSGMIDMKGGARSIGGLTHDSPSIAQSAKVLGASAFARWDQWVSPELRDYLMAEAAAILARQTPEGEITLPYTRAPVATDSTQGTAQAIITWKQAYERSADDRWLTAIHRGEGFLRGIVAGWRGSQPPTQALDYAALGLLAAGVSPSEPVLVDLRTRIAGYHTQDGSWPAVAGDPGAPLYTGESLYTLRMLGMTDRDDAIARGTKWLIAAQQQNGGWSGAGFGKAEAMWAVLGLVSIDVLTVAVDGVDDGQRVTGAVALDVHARDNSGAQVSRVEIYVDDLPVHGACGASTTYRLDTTALETGRHVVDVVARNSRGEVSRRRLDVYTGDVYLAQVGSTWSGGETQISLRDLEAASAHEVRLEVVQDGTVVHTETRKGAQGPLHFSFHGAAGKYEARLTYRDTDGVVKQTETLPFVNDSLDAQKANYTQVGGALAMPDASAAENAQLDLVDDNGKVVAKTTSTKSGEYRFKNVEAGKHYSVHVNKKGFDAAPVSIDAKMGADVRNDMVVKKK